MPDQITMAFEEWYSIDEYDDETLVLLGAFSVGWKAHEKAAQQGEQAIVCPSCESKHAETYICCIVCGVQTPCA